MQREIFKEIKDELIDIKDFEYKTSLMHISHPFEHLVRRT